MTARSAPPRPLPSPLERLLTVRIALNWELAIYAAIFGAAIALRFWDLGARSLHHDESIHAQWAWRLAQGDYVHSPIFHGPFYYHIQGFFFLIFGASDYTARLTAALFGSGIVALPLLLRRRLGLVGTIAAVAFLAFSPTLVYYSRFFREDIYMGFFVLLMAAAMWRYVDGARERWLVVFALAFTGSMLTKEGTFLVVAVFLVFLDVWLASALARATLIDRELNTTIRRSVVTLALAPYAWAIAALWPFLGSPRRSMAWGRTLPRQGDVLIMLMTLTIPLLTPATRTWLLEPLGLIEKTVPLADGAFTSRLNWESHLRGGITGADARALGGLFAVSISLAAFIGLQWKPRLWGLTFAGCTFVYLTLMTSLWTNMDGLVSGPWGSLDYWMTQQDAHRGDQPWFYYYMLMGAYEFLPLAICVGGIWWSTVRGTAFSRFLVFWLAGMWLALSWGAEKMPWLNVHLTIPACLLAAWTIKRAFDAWRERPPLPRILPALGAVAAVAMGGLAVAAFSPGGDLALAARLLAVAIAIALVAAIARPFGRPAVGAFVTAAVVGGLALFSVRAMTLAVYERGDVPKDMLVYTQSSPDITRIADQIDALAAATGKGFALPIAVDSTDSFSWPWAWYLRDYNDVRYQDFTTGVPPGDFAVLLVNSGNVGRVNDALAERAGGGFGSPIQYPHRWWFDETYKNALITTDARIACTARAGACGPFRPETWRVIGSGVFGGGWLDTWFHYWRDHDPDALSGKMGERACNSCGSVDAYAFFPANFDPARGTITLKPIEPPKPRADSAGRPTFGGAGTQPGQFFSPVDIEADSAGNLYVIDYGTRRLQKFDPAGNFLASTDVRGEQGGVRQASEPWGLAVAPDGTVAVADTFGHRIRLFDGNLQPLLAFGQAADLSRPVGPLDFFGPRDAAFDPQGNLWVTDTGNHRLLVFNRQGESLRVIGKNGAGEGEFREPVGVAIGPGGAVYVADMYNARVVVLDGEGRFRSSFKVDGWGGQDVQDKPYLEVLPNGNIAVGLPGQNQVRVYTPSGALSATIAPEDEPLSRPYGILATVDGKLWVVEGGSKRVRLFPIP